MGNFVGFNLEGPDGVNYGSTQIGSVWQNATNLAGSFVVRTRTGTGSGLSEKFRIDNSGNVGIGTVAPLSKLGVLGNLSIGGTYGAIAAPTGGAIIEGNVGIGTTSPGTKLHVEGAGSILVGTAPETIGYFKQTAAGTHTGVVIDSLDGQDAYLFFGEGGSPRWDLRADAGTNGFEIREQTGGLNTVRMAVNAGGNVGIGTTAPSTLLHLGLAGTTKGTLGLAGNTSGLVTIQPTAAAGTFTLTLPDNDGGANEVLKTDGSGVLSWVAQPVGLTDTDYGDITVGSTGTTMSIDADVIDWADIADSTTLDASTSIAFGGSTYALTFTNNGSGNEVHNLSSTGDFEIQDNGTSAFLVNDSGQTMLGLASVSTSAKLSLSNTISATGSTSAIAGIHGDYTFNNGGTASYVQVGNRFVFNNAPTTNPNTMVGEVIRTIDNTALANLVRGIEVVSNAGSNTAGTNTGIRTTGATFGIQAITNGLAGGVSAPAAIFGENTGTTAGDIMRLYSASITTAPSVATFYHDTSTFSGTGLLMDFATGSGTFSGNFIDLQNNNTTAFKVTSTGLTSVGLGSTASTNAVCSSLANTTAPTSGVAYELRDCNAAPAADYAEMYPVESDIEFGDIVATGSEMIMTYGITDGNIDWNKEKGAITKLTKTNKEYQSNVIGIVSDNYGDFSSTGNNIKKESNPMPVALSGRVPVKISNSSEEINSGDYLTTSEEGGKATKATKSGQVIGKALENWSPDSGKETVMIYIEQGYYSGSGLEGLEIVNFDKQFTGKITFESQVEFNVPPIFNKDTAGFAVIKAGARKVDITFENPYVAQPIVSTTISFENSDNLSDDQIDQFFNEDIKFIVTNKSQNGFTIIINKESSRDVRFSWTAFAVKDAKLFESVMPGLTIENPEVPSSTPEEGENPTENTSPLNSAEAESGDHSSGTNDLAEPTPEVIIEEVTTETPTESTPTETVSETPTSEPESTPESEPQSTPIPEPEPQSTPTPEPITEPEPVPEPTPSEAPSE
jgi:hypothetical protein